MKTSQQLGAKHTLDVVRELFSFGNAMYAPHAWPRVFELH